MLVGGVNSRKSVLRCSGSVGCRVEKSYLSESQHPCVPVWDLKYSLRDWKYCLHTISKFLPSCYSIAINILPQTLCIYNNSYLLYFRCYKSIKKDLESAFSLNFHVLCVFLIQLATYEIVPLTNMNLGIFFHKNYLPLSTYQCRHLKKKIRFIHYLFPYYKLRAFKVSSWSYGFQYHQKNAYNMFLLCWSW